MCEKLNKTKEIQPAAIASNFGGQENCNGKGGHENDVYTWESWLKMKIPGLHSRKTDFIFGVGD